MKNTQNKIECFYFKKNHLATSETDLQSATMAVEQLNCSIFYCSCQTMEYTTLYNM